MKELWKRFKVFATMKVYVLIFWVCTLWNVGGINKCFGGDCCLCLLPWRRRKKKMRRNLESHWC